MHKIIKNILLVQLVNDLWMNEQHILFDLNIYVQTFCLNL